MLRVVYIRLQAMPIVDLSAADSNMHGRPCGHHYTATMLAGRAHAHLHQPTIVSAQLKERVCWCGAENLN